MEQHLAEQVTIIAVLGIVIVGAVSAVAGRIGVAAPLLLTVVGIGLGFVPGASEIIVDPEIILTVVLPPLLYAAALQVPIVDFRRNLRVIALLAVVLVIVSAVLVGGLVVWIWPAVGLALAIALGAVVAPPDAVAATSLGKRLGLPPRIVTILEGEGLVNDATALVLLSTAVGIAANAGDPDGAVELGDVVGAFAWAVVGAILVGLVVGWLAVVVRARIHDLVLDTTLSIVVPFVAFLAAEQIGASGVVGVVVAGIVVGNASPGRVGARERQSERTSWRTFTMVIEHAVFLYMGLRLRPVVDAVESAEQSLWQVVGVGLLVTLLLVLLRFAAMPLLLWSIRFRARRLERLQRRSTQRMQQADDRFADTSDRRISGRLEQFRRRLEQREHDVTAERDQALGWRDGTVLGWAGMRGVVTVAAVQTLPHEHPYYAALVLVAFVVAIVTLLSQGLTLPMLVRALRLQRDSTVEERTELLELTRRVAEAGSTAMSAEMAALAAPLSDDMRDEILQMPARRVERASRMLGIGEDVDEEQTRAFVAVRRAQLVAERAALKAERQRGAFSSETLAAMQRQLDVFEIQLDAMTGDDPGR
ncbi:sodium:proton antiporter [Agrococcus versicolor]|uniref:Sodium:proton antiporter n=1 Tax=Agrococcus versicolor TaxID=501482 RepID=A0ABP5MDX5_9MICO